MVSFLQYGAKIAKQGGGAQDKNIPGYNKNVYRIALQNFVFLSFCPVTKMNYHLQLCHVGQQIKVDNTFVFPNSFHCNVKSMQISLITLSKSWRLGFRFSDYANDKGSHNWLLANTSRGRMADRTAPG